MTKDFLIKLCSHNEGMYSVPKLNDILYLHYQGIVEIGNLDDYINVKCIYFQNNMIKKIENLDKLKELTMLFLNDNSIQKIENLESLDKLSKIDLSHNSIKTVENLSGVISLTSLDLSYNELTTVDDVAHLAECTQLTLLRLSFNKLEDPKTIDVLSKLRKLRVLFLDGNSLIGKIPNYRKKVINQFPDLTYLDQRPVKSTERVLAETWQASGPEAEDLLRLEWKVTSDQEFKERHLKLFERMKETYPDATTRLLAAGDSEFEASSTSDGGQREIIFPWDNKSQSMEKQRSLIEEIYEVENVWPICSENNAVLNTEVSSEFGHSSIRKRIPIEENDDISISNITYDKQLSNSTEKEISNVCFENLQVDLMQLKFSEEKFASDEKSNKSNDKIIPEELRFTLDQRLQNELEEYAHNSEKYDEEHIAEEDEQTNLLTF